MKPVLFMHRNSGPQLTSVRFPVGGNPRKDLNLGGGLHENLVRRWPHDFENANKLLYWYALLAVAPILVIWTNLSFYLFPFLLLRFKRTFGYFIAFKPLIHIPVVAFMCGAILSTIDSVNINKSLVVLPNYLYWGVLVVFLSSHARHLDYKLVARAGFVGIIIVTLYYYLQHEIPRFPTFRLVSPNSYSFTVICFSPLAIAHLMKTRGKQAASIFLLVLSALQLFEGRRVGFVVVTIAGFLTIYAQRLRVKQALLLIMLIFGLPTLLSMDTLQETIRLSNERIYDLLYNSDEITRSDKSYLVRKAMVQKGLAMYDKDPFTGIGLNNFASHEIDFDYYIEGSTIRLQRQSVEEKSAHNSYIFLLAEGGLLLLVPFLILFVIVILYHVVRYNTIPVDSLPVFIGFVGMVVHLAFISEIVNVHAWYLLGLALASIYRPRCELED
jgi:O-antigen ligase